jgi:RimJ/RimL family protein N-acetyltransferase
MDVRLRKVIEADLPILFEHQWDPEANAMANFPARERDAFMAHWTKILADETLWARTILFGPEVAGNVVSWEQDGKQLIGYWIGKEYWGRGIATLALSEFLKVLTSRPLYAHVAKHNVGSIRVLEKCGFTLCSDEIEDLVFKLGDDSR